MNLFYFILREYIYICLYIVINLTYKKKLVLIICNSSFVASWKCQALTMSLPKSTKLHSSRGELEELQRLLVC